jgi:hypothetical protein
VRFIYFTVHKCTNKHIHTYIDQYSWKDKTYTIHIRSSRILPSYEQWDYKENRDCTHISRFFFNPTCISFGGKIRIFGFFKYCRFLHGSTSTMHSCSSLHAKSQRRNVSFWHAHCAWLKCKMQNARLDKKNRERERSFQA